MVTHQLILDNVWKDVTVAPNTLQRRITQLRKALGDDAKRQIKMLSKLTRKLAIVW
ncbi:winged helix-turn-helix domain-containing protein [Aliikangiella sp. IMCC44359]|uniref:winged helix-turn-helix domain-containing protein n=1 Tax=Aliikangiella sp. IMCC44359 TaxID=3459125 RepID=UPI00403A83D4